MSRSSMASVARTRSAVPTGPYDGQWIRLERHHPTGRDDVVEISGVVAVEVSQEESSERPCPRSGRGRAHEHATPAVDEQVARLRSDQGGRTGTGRIGEWAAAAEHDDLHGTVVSSLLRAMEEMSPDSG